MLNSSSSSIAAKQWRSHFSYLILNTEQPCPCQIFNMAAFDVNSAELKQTRDS